MNYKFSKDQVIPQVKTREIQAVRDILATSQNEKRLEQFVLVSNWINQFADKKTNLLEIGCGSAVLKNYLHAQYFGIDPIKHEDLCEGTDFKVGYGESIPYPTKSFSYVLIKDAINYFLYLEPLFDEASRVLKDDGAILITEFVGGGYSPAIQKLKNIVKKYFRISSNIWDRTYLNYHTSHDIIKAAELRGFVVEYKYPRTDSRYYLMISKSLGATKS